MITIKNLKLPTTQDLTKIVVGSTFLGKIGVHSGLFLVSHDFLVDLQNPFFIWTDYHKLVVDNYEPVDIEITIK
jgi:hypothetical protein